MAATLATGFPKKVNDRHIWKVTLTNTNDTVTAAPGRSFNFTDYPVIAHIQHGSGSTLLAQYTLDPNTENSNYITMEPGDITKDHAAIFDFFATAFRIAVDTGTANPSTVWIESPFDLDIKYT